MAIADAILGASIAKADANKKFAYPLIDTGSGYPARPASVPAGLAFYQGPTQPTGASVGDRWHPVYTPRPVIIDTDWFTDVDDAVAMRLAAHYERVGNIDILATIVNTTAPNGAPSLDAFWRTENRPMLIGQLAGANSDLTTGGTYQAAMLNLPHYGTDASVYPDSTTVYRTALAAAPDGSVDIVSIGYLNAISSLLQSPADGIDARTGLALVTAKARRLYVMGGQYPSGNENNFNRSTKSRASANYVVTNWPTAVPIYFAGYEVGGSVMTGDNLINLVPTTDPLLAALITYGSSVTGRNSWDPMLVQMAALGVTASGYTTVRGTNAVNASTGANTFTTGASGPHYYVVKSNTDAQFKASINALLVPGRQPKPASGVQVLTATGWAPASYLDRNLGGLSKVISGTTDLGALASMDAADVAVADGAAVSSVLGANSFPEWVQAAGTNQPTYRASIGGKPAIQFAGTHWLESLSGVPQSQNLTVYALVRFATLPSSNQTIISDDNAGSSPVLPDRSMHLKGITGGVAQAVGFVNNAGASNGFTDNYTGTVVDTWQVLTLRRTGTTVEVLINGNTDGATAASGSFASQFSANTLHIGASKHTGTTATEGLTGYVSKVRVYSGAHTGAQVTATIAALTA